MEAPLREDLEPMTDEHDQPTEVDSGQPGTDTVLRAVNLEPDTDDPQMSETETESQDQAEDSLPLEADTDAREIHAPPAHAEWEASAPVPAEDDEDDAEESAEEEEEAEATVESVIEAVLFANDEPVTITKLAVIVESTTKLVKQSVARLNEKYRRHHTAFRIEQIAGGLQMLTLPQYNHWLKKLIKVRGDSRLSPAALETLAIVAYKQPAIRADIEAIRGVASGEILRSLMHKGLVKMTGRAEVIGRPMQYGTTRKFLEVFGLNSLKDLPTIEELKKPSED